MTQPMLLDASPATTPARIVEALKWLFGAIGISSLLLGTGFISDFAFQERLGYRLSNTDDLIGYSLEAGRFLVSATLLLLDWLAQRRQLITILVLAMIIVTARFFLRGRFHPRARFLVTGRMVALVLVAAAVFEIVIFDVPALSLRGALLHPLKVPDVVTIDWLSSNLTRKIWEDEVCSRLEVPHYPALRTVVPEGCPLAPTAHKTRKVQRFALNFLLTLLMTILAGSLLAKQRGANPWLGLFTAVALLDLLLVPYTYAKTIRPTTADDVIVSWRMSVLPLGGETRAAPFPSNATEGEREDVDPDFNLLYKRDDEVVLFERGEGHIWVVPEDQIGLLRIKTERDVVQSLIRDRLEKVARTF